MTLDESFIRIAAHWDASEAAAILRAVRPRRAIVHRLSPSGDRFYLFELDQLLGRLAANRGLDVAGALTLDDLPPTPTSRGPMDGAPHAILLEGGRILGVLTSNVVFRGGFETSGPISGRPSAGRRALVASAPNELGLGREASLLVKLSQLPDPRSLPLEVAPGEEVEIVLNVSDDLLVNGAAEGILKVTDADESLPLRFKLVGKRVGDGVVTVYAFKNRQAVGSLRLTIRVIDQSSVGVASERASPIGTAVAPPDLSLLVFENRARCSYTMRLLAADPGHGLNFRPFGPITLAGDIEPFFTELYRDIEAILGARAPNRDKADRLARKGTYLFERLVPEPLRRQLWALRGRIRSVQIQSEEPWIPWELCKLTGTDPQGLTVEGGFLCEEFEVTRWLMGISQRVGLTLDKVGLVVPSSDLLATPDERQHLLDLAESGRTVVEIPAHAVELRAALAGGTFDCLHFAGHGSFVEGNADRSEMTLDGGSRFSPDDLTGVVANLGRKRHPLVFLNACEIGRSGASLVGMGGWAHAFLNAGAGAFIGAHWKVSDDSAALFAQSFYDDFLKPGHTVSQSAHRARRAIKRDDDPTWLAYTVYAHPEAKLDPQQ